MNIFKAQAVKDPEAVTRAIPVIDFGPAFRGEPGGLEVVARQVRRASEEIGFFYLAGHGVPEAVVDAAFAASREFHALPDAVKGALAINENNIGYLAPNQSIQGASTVHKATRPNYNESFFISHDRGPHHPAIVNGETLRGRNQWPEGHPEMRAAMVATCASCTIPRRRETTTSSSGRGRTPTIPSSPSWRAPRCRGWRCACPAGSGWPRR